MNLVCLPVLYVFCYRRNCMDETRCLMKEQDMRLFMGKSHCCVVIYVFALPSSLSVVFIASQKDLKLLICNYFKFYKQIILKIFGLNVIIMNYIAFYYYYLIA